jgi:arylsulfatase
MNLAASFRKSAMGASIVCSFVMAFGCVIASAQAAQRPNIVMLMTDDTGWNDFGPIQAVES